MATLPSYQGQLQNGQIPSGIDATKFAPVSSASRNMPLGTNVKDLPPIDPANYTDQTRYDGYGQPYNVRVPIGTPNTTVPKVSTTTISNGNKMDAVPGINNKFQQLSDTGIRTDTSTGTATYANGAAVGETSPASADTSSEEASFQANLDEMKARTDAATASLIENIQRRFEQRRSEQRDINERQKKGYTNALLMGGVTGQGSSAQYAPISSEGIIGAQESYGLKQIAALDAEEQDLIAQAKAAQTAQDFKLLEAKNQQIERKRQEKMAAAEELNKTIAAQNRAMQEANQQSAKDNAIAELYSQGITDPGDILKKLTSQGMQITSGEIAKTISNITPEREGINKIMQEAAANGASEAVLAKIAGSRNIQEAITAGASFMIDPLDRSIKAAQLRKLQQIGVTGSPEESAAITNSVVNENDPTKLVSTLFRLNPKLKTNQDINNAAAVISAVNDLGKKSTDGKVEGYGLFGGGFTPQFLLGQEGIANRQSISAIDGKLQQWLSGAALSKKQEKLVEKMIPDKNDTDATVRTKLNGLVNYMLGDIKGRVTAQGVDFEYIPIDIWKDNNISTEPNIRSSVVSAVAEGHDPNEVIDFVITNYPDQADQIQQARDAGYSDEEILAVFAQ